jgi:hypothetical protein
MAGGDIPVLDTLSCYGRTLLSAVGVDGATLDAEILGGKVIGAALA